MTVISWGAVSTQSFTVKGIVIDAESGGAMIGCSIVINGTRSGTIIGTNDTCSIRTDKGAVSVLSFIGHHIQKIRVASACSDVALETDTQRLEEYIVIDYGVETQEMICKIIPIAMNRSLLYNVEMSTEEYKVI